MSWPPVSDSGALPSCVPPLCVCCSERLTPVWVGKGFADRPQVLVTLLQCRPINAWWDRFDPVHPMPRSQYHCGVESTKFFYGNAIPTIVTDILMLVLPAPYIWNLQLPGGQKLALVGIFLVGLLYVSRPCYGPHRWIPLAGRAVMHRPWGNCGTDYAWIASPWCPSCG